MVYPLRPHAYFAYGPQPGTDSSLDTVILLRIHASHRDNAHMNSRAESQPLLHQEEMRGMYRRRAGDLPPPAGGMEQAPPILRSPAQELHIFFDT